MLLGGGRVLELLLRWLRGMLDGSLRLRLLLCLLQALLLFFLHPLPALLSFALPCHPRRI